MRRGPFSQLVKKLIDREFLKDSIHTSVKQHEKSYTTTALK
jgi:hypothetical protein